MRSRDDSPTGTPVQVDDPAILIRINRTYEPEMGDQKLYEATRGIWKAQGTRRNKARYAMAIYQGVIQEVYRIDGWYPAGTTPYRTRSFPEERLRGRWEFVGEVAEAPLREKYIGRSVKAYFPYGAANPIMYVNCTA